MDNRKFGKLVKKSTRPPFNELAKPNMSKEAKAVMEEAMQRACDEQAKIMSDDGVKNVTKNDQDKNVLRNSESWVCSYCGKRVYSMEVHSCFQPYCGVRYK